MDTPISVERVEPAVEETDVCHVDQLSDRERNCLVRLTQGERADVDRQVGVALAEYGLIKFTEYVRVTVSDVECRSNGVGVNS